MTGPPSGIDQGDLHARFVEEAPVLFTLVDTGGRILYVNPASRAFFGLEPEQCLGRSAFDFVHEEDREATRQAFERWVQTGASAPLRHENRQVHRDGSVRDVLWTIQPRTAEEGGLEGFASVGIDITAMRAAGRAALERETWYRSVLAGTLDPLITIDAWGVIRAASDSVEAAFGWKPEELLGRNISVLMPEPHRSAHDGYLANYRRTGETNILGRTREFEVLHRDGRLIPIELSVSRVDIPGSEEPFFTGSFRDVSARKQLERARQAERNMLKSLARIGESAAILSHEIKNPITGLSIALRALARQMSEEEQSLVQELVARLQRIEAMIRRTLSFARPLDLRPAPCEAREILERARKELLSAADERETLEVEVEAETGLGFEADPALIQDALRNVLENAVEALRERGGPGRIRLSARQDASGDLWLEVEDDGPGFPPNREDLLRPFVTTKARGTGIGLSFTSKIVEEHGGELAIGSSQDLGGARVSLRLPGPDAHP